MVILLMWPISFYLSENYEKDTIIVSPILQMNLQKDSVIHLKPPSL